MSYVADELAKVSSDNPQMYWRDRSWSKNSGWAITVHPDGDSFCNVSDYEYIAYSPNYVWVIIYDCYIAQFYKLPRSPLHLTSDIHCVEAG